MTMRGAEGGISEPPGPPYLIGMAQVRREAIGQIYDRENGKEPPLHNIVSEALQAYYTSGRSFFYYGSQLDGDSSLLCWSIIKLLGNVCESVP